MLLTTLRRPRRRCLPVLDSLRVSEGVLWMGEAVVPGAPTNLVMVVGFRGPFLAVGLDPEVFLFGQSCRSPGPRAPKARRLERKVKVLGSATNLLVRLQDQINHAVPYLPPLFLDTGYLTKAAAI